MVSLNQCRSVAPDNFLVRNPPLRSKFIVYFLFIVHAFLKQLQIQYFTLFRRTLLKLQQINYYI